jgi:hypothetical protein
MLDSGVVAVPMHEAIGDQLQWVFVDHGLLRKDEGEQVVRLFRDHYNIPLVRADASKQFLDALAGTIDPEKSARRSARCSSTCSRPRPRRRRSRAAKRRLTPQTAPQIRSSCFSTPLSRGMAAKVGSRSLRSLMKATWSR